MKVLLNVILLIVVSCNMMADSNTSIQSIEPTKYSVKEHSLAIESIPEMNVVIKQPVNWYLVLLPITTILIVIVGFLLTRLQIIRKSEESMQTSKMEVLSKNRQAWINTLRDDISKFIGQVDSVKKHISLFDKKNADENEKVTMKDVILTANKMRELKSKIELLINPNEEKHITLVNLLNLTIDNLQNRDSNDNNIKEITSLAQKILKEEWVRVKNGD